MRSRKDVAKTALERQTSKVLREEEFLTNRSPSTQHGVLNEYVRVEDAEIVGRGSQSSSVKLYRSTKNLKLYAIKAFHQVRQGSKRPGAKDTLSLRPTHSEREEVLREADIMRRLQHPNIVRIEELIDDCYGDTHTDTENDAMYLVMDYVEGGSLQTHLEQNAPLSEELLKRCMADTVRGLMYLHDARIIHMDIKPANILFAADHSCAKICDFGTSTLSSSVSNAKKGTALFRAPELHRGGYPEDFAAGIAADVWSLGSTLYYLATFGRVHSSPDHVFKALTVDPVGLDSESMGLSPQLCDLLQMLLAHSPEARASLEQAADHPWLVDTPPSLSVSGPAPAEATLLLSQAFASPVREDPDEEAVASRAEIDAWMVATEPRSEEAQQ